MSEALLSRTLIASLRSALLKQWANEFKLHMDMRIQIRKYVIPANEFIWSKIERSKCGPQGERQEA